MCDMVYSTSLNYVVNEKLEDIKEVIGSRKSQKDRKHNGQSYYTTQTASVSSINNRTLTVLDYLSNTVSVL